MRKENCKTCVFRKNNFCTEKEIYIDKPYNNCWCYRNFITFRVHEEYQDEDEDYENDN